ncbi:MAG: hypothetical protein P8Y18_10460 [Candidatus Bathyarchaeota archaeon]
MSIDSENESQGHSVLQKMILTKNQLGFSQKFRLNSDYYDNDDNDYDD